MSIKKELYGIKDGKEVYLYTLDNGCGLCAKIMNYGCIIKNLVYNDVDVVLGRDTIEDYFENNGYFGAVIGRNSNRIENAEFVLNDITYKLYKNKGENNLHGGKIGFDKKVWDTEIKDTDTPTVVFKTNSPDGEEGFPGNADIKVTYTLTKENSIKIQYEAVCDKDTVMNLTNHSYFNLNGHNSGTVDNHTLWVNSEFYTPNTEECMPYGEILLSKGTAFDFKQEKAFKESFLSGEKQIDMFGGLDHNFVLSGTGLRHCATLKGDISGIKMDMYTNLPGVQIYTANAIEQNRICKDGASYPVHGAVCLETQHFPNNLKYAFFPTSILKKGEKYEAVTEYKFS